MTAPLTYRDAAPGDVPAVRALLAASGLPSEDVSYGAQLLLAAWDGATLAGVVALEGHGKDALLRSLAVAEPWRGRGVGSALTTRALERARKLHLRDLYLLTGTAEPFFAARGWRRVDRAAVPAPVRTSRQFEGLCPATVPCLVRAVPDADAPDAPAPSRKPSAL
ncbi:MAG: arsenic resistance N-acetyltransferase ArsN2 [Anaeromyxobacteraceae bacterium]